MVTPVKNKQVTKKQINTPTPTEKLNKIGIEVICEYVANGDSLRSWSKLNNFAQQTVLDWINADESRAGHYAHAREARADAVFDSLDDVSEQAAHAETAVEVAGLRLKSDNIKWKLARMNAKKYGEKTTIAGDSENPLEISVIERVIVDPKK